VRGKDLRQAAHSDVTEQKEAKKMLAVVKALVLAFAVTGVAGAGIATGVAHVPLQKAIDIHKEHLGANSTMPEKSIPGQQNALDHLMENQQRWLSKPHNDTSEPDNDLNETDID
jgi:hypothetical protein